MRILFATLALLWLSLPAHAQADLRQSLYSCGIGDHGDEGIINLTAAPTDAQNWTAPQLSVEASYLPPVLYPAKPGKGQFYFSNSDGPEGYLVTIRFSDGGNHYRLTSLAIPPTDGDMGGFDAGLEATLPDGTVNRYQCGEVPYEFISYMRSAMACDMDNPHGAAGCDPAAVPQRAPGEALW